MQEFGDYKQQVCKYNTANMSHNIQNQSIASSHDKNSKTQLHLLKAHNSNLEERVRILSNEIMNKETEFQLKLEHQHKASVVLYIDLCKFVAFIVIRRIIFAVLSRRTYKIGTHVDTEG